MHKHTDKKNTIGACSATKSRMSRPGQSFWLYTDALNVLPSWPRVPFIHDLRSTLYHREREEIHPHKLPMPLRFRAGGNKRRGLKWVCSQQCKFMVRMKFEAKVISWGGWKKNNTGATNNVAVADFEISFKRQKLNYRLQLNTIFLGSIVSFYIFWSLAIHQDVIN